MRICRATCYLRSMELLELNLNVYPTLCHRFEDDLSIDMERNVF